MLKIFIATALVAVSIQAAVLDTARERRSLSSSPDLTAQDMTKPFTKWAEKDSAQVNSQVRENWNNKAEQGKEIERAGKRTEEEGHENARKVEATNKKAVVKALNDVDNTVTAAGVMQGVGGGSSSGYSSSPVQSAGGYVGGSSSSGFSSSPVQSAGGYGGGSPPPAPPAPSGGYGGNTNNGPPAMPLNVVPNVGFGGNNGAVGGIPPMGGIVPPVPMGPPAGGNNGGGGYNSNGFNNGNNGQGYNSNGFNNGNRGGNNGGGYGGNNAGNGYNNGGNRNGYN